MPFSMPVEVCLRQFLLVEAMPSSEGRLPSFGEVSVGGLHLPFQVVDIGWVYVTAKATMLLIVVELPC
jgi:hypothetical protein